MTTYTDTFNAVYNARRAVEDAARAGDVPSSLWHELIAAEMYYAAAREQRVANVSREMDAA